MLHLLLLIFLIDSFPGIDDDLIKHNRRPGMTKGQIEFSTKTPHLILTLLPTDRLEGPTKNNRKKRSAADTSVCSRYREKECWSVCVCSMCVWKYYLLLLLSLECLIFLLGIRYFCVMLAWLYVPCQHALEKLRWDSKMNASTKIDANIWYKWLCAYSILQSHHYLYSTICNTDDFKAASQQ